MKKHIIIALLCLMVQAGYAQKMRDVFVAMPDSVMPYLTKVNKADCIDFIDSKMRAIVKNRLDNQCEMTRLTDDYTQMKLSKGYILEMKLLPVNDSTKIICMIRTLGDSLKQFSNIHFFTSDWKQELKRDKYITLPKLSEYMAQRPDTISEEKYDRLTEKIDIFLQSAAFDNDGNLAFTLNIGEMNRDDRNEVSPFVKNPLTYNWRNNAFLKKD